MAAGKAGQKPDLGKDGAEKTTESFWHIDKEMLRFKIHFLLHSGGLVAAIPFVSLFAKEKLGLAASSLGAVLTAQMFLYIFTKPLIGYIADYFNRLKAIICVLTLITISCYFSLLALPKIEREEAFSSFVSFSNNATYFKREFSKINENETNVLFPDSSQLSVTHQLELKDKKFLLCSFQTGRCFHVSAQYMLMDETENNVGYYIQVKVNKEEEFVTFCNGNNSFDLCACLGPSSCQDSSGDCMSLFCSDVLTTKATNSNDSLFMCSTSTQKLDTIVVSCSAQNVSEDHAMESQRTFSDFHTFQFWVFAFLLSVSSISENANCTLSDTACYESVQKSKADFGKQRLWGSVGWGGFAAFWGWLNGYTGGFLASWSLMAAMFLLCLANITRLELTKPCFAKNILKGVRTVFKSKKFLAFELANLMNGVGIGICWFYLMWFIKSIGGSDLLCGLTIAVQSFGGCIPFMFFSGWIIRKFGHLETVTFALLTYGIRFLYYSYLHDPWWILPMELTHGITYGLNYTTMASFGKISSKPGTEATTQSILFSTHEGLGAGIGCVCVGIGFDYLGVHQTFFFVSIFFGCGFIINFILCLIIKKQNGTLRSKV